MDEQTEIQKAVGRYLEKVAAELTNVPPDEKDAILQSVESHIYDALERRSPGAATIADLAFVFTEMASPSSYAQPAKAAPAPCPPPRAPAPALREASPREVPPCEQRLCWYPVVGLILAPFAIAVAVMVTSLVIAMSAPADNKHLGSWVLYSPFFFRVEPMALVLPLISTAFGLMGILKIRASRGALYGMPLAVAVALLFPLAVSDLLATFVAVLSVPGLREVLGGFAKPLFLLELALIMLANFVVCRRVWRWANRPAQACEQCPPPPSSPASREVSPQEASHREASPREVPPREQRLCWYPVVGLILAPISVAVGAAILNLAAVILPLQQAQGNVAPTAGYEWGALAFRPIHALAMVVLLGGLALSSALGLVGISKIRASRGALYGMPQAVLATILFPCAIFDLLMLLVGMRFLFLPSRFLAIPLALVIVVLVNIAVYRRVWRWANRPAEGQPA